MNKKDFNKTTIIFFIVAFVLVSLFAAIVLSVSDNDIDTSSSNSDGFELKISWPTNQFK